MTNWRKVAKAVTATGVIAGASLILLRGSRYARRVQEGCKKMSTLQVQWKQAAATQPLAPRYDFSLVSVQGPAGSKIYAVGGHGSEVPGAEVQVLDSSLSSWATSTSSFAEGVDASSLQRGSHATAVVGKSIFVYGGYAKEQTLGDVLEFNTETKTWSRPAIEGLAPPPRSSPSVTVIGTKVYIIGGHSEEGSMNDVHILDVAQKKWVTPTVWGSPPAARCSHSAHAIGSSRILVFGGYGERPTNDTWILEVDTPYVRQQRETLGAALEVVAWSPASTAPPLAPAVICGPSGVGKGTLINKLMAEFPGSCGFSVSHTTRAPREGEVDGVHYNFTSREVMEREVGEKKFLEFADVHGNMYGTSIAAVQKVTDSGKMCILDIDVQGAKQVKDSSLPATFVFVSPPSFEELEKRLRGRGTETEAQIEKRLKNAKAEMERGQDRSLFNHMLVNDNLDDTYVKLKAVLGLGEEGDKLAASKTLVPRARSGHLALMLGSKLLIHGGSGEKGVTLDDMYALETSEITGGAPGKTHGIEWLMCEEAPPGMLDSLWSALGWSTTLTPGARYSHAGVALSESEALVVGGYDASSEKALGDSTVLRIVGR